MEARLFTHSGGETYQEAEQVGSLTQQSASETSAMTPRIVQPASPCSQGSADSTTDSTGPGSGTCSCANQTPGGAPCCEHGSPVSPSMTMWHKSHRGAADEADIWQETDVAPSLNPMDLRYPSNPPLLISSQVVSPARTSPLPENAEDSPGNDPACSSSTPESSTLFDPVGFSSRTYPGCSPRTAVGTSESCLERWPTSGTAWHGGFSTHVSSECRSDDAGCSSSEPSLSEILEPPLSVPGRYLLSARAARGILRRAKKRARVLPPHLNQALWAVARQITSKPSRGWRALSEAEAAAVAGLRTSSE